MVEVRSFLLSYAITSAVCTVVMGVSWIRNRRHVAGADLWLIGFVMLFFALLFTTVRNTLPDLFGIMIPNFLVIAATLSLLMGLERFVGKPGSHLHNYILLIVFTIVHAWFTYGQPNLSIRTINFSLAFIIVLGQGMWLLLQRVEPDQRPATRGVGLIILVFCLLAFGRLVNDLIFDSGEDFFQPGLYGIFYVLANQMVLIILTFGLVLMVNRRLISNLERGLLQRRQAEEALQDSRSRHQSLFDNMMDGYAHCKMIFGANGQPEDFIYLDVNRSFEELTGLTNVRGKRVTELIPEIRDLNPGLFETYARVVLTGKSEKFETRINPMGMWFSISVYRPEADHFAAIFENITEQKQMEAAVKTNQKLAEELYESAPDALITVNVQGQITRLNSRAVAMFGYNHEELLNKPIETIIPKSLHIKHEQDRKKYIESPHVRAMGSGLELRAIKKDGQQIPVEIELSPLQIGEETFVTADIRDISEQRQLNQTLQYRTNILSALNQATLDLVDRREMEDILHTLLTRIGALLEAPDLSFDLVENEDALVTYAVTSEQPLKRGDIMHRGEGGWLSWQAIDSGEPAVLEDYSTWPKRRVLFEGYPIHAIMIIPVHQRNRVIGAINLSRREPNRPFNETDLYAARQLAQMVSLVLDNADIYSQLQSQLAESVQREVDLLDAQEQLVEQQRTTATIDERQRMARDLHDSVNQSIHSLVLFTETLVSTLDKENIARARQISERLQESARQALKETRLLLYQTESHVEGRSVNLVEDLNARLESVENRAGVRTGLQLEGSLENCPGTWRENLFWITIEALNNSLKHAQARSVNVILRFDPSFVEMEISDDGRGFDVNAPNPGGYGLRNMRGRAERLGGTLTFTSAPDKGTRVLFRAEI